MWAPRDVAYYWKVDPNIVMDWVHRYGMPHEKLGPRLYRFDPAVVRAWRPPAEAAQ